MKHQYQISDEKSNTAALSSGLPLAETEHANFHLAQNVAEEHFEISGRVIPGKHTEHQQESAGQLAVLLQQEAKSRQKEEICAVLWSITFVLSALVLMLLQRASTQESLAIRLLSILGMMVTIGGVAAYRAYKRSRLRRSTLAAHLIQTKSLGSTTVLIDALNVPDASVRNLAQQALIEQLPTLQANEADLVGDAQRTTIVKLLSIAPTDHGYRDLKELFSQSAYRREVDVRLAILKALEQVGSAKELPIVERLARGGRMMPGGPKILPEIQAEAQACLPYLLVRAQQQNFGEQLLRPSSRDSISADTLLRPSNSTSSESPDQLLRASMDTSA